ncbi:hypothetical protein SAMN05421849_0219 [Pontibaca methylaminivorans]|uniref:Uncharacterized protein n=1 Tax=Pontibaca methylaminivorans TaxID=515897 RepID=A0A1R3WBX6_9RHOB|nr:hypothetical protein SAMN05421849_0219 [Pontibaca methylaminivorans]
MSDLWTLVTAALFATAVALLIAQRVVAWLCR